MTNEQANQGIASLRQTSVGPAHVGQAAQLLIEMDTPLRHVLAERGDVSLLGLTSAGRARLDDRVAGLPDEMIVNAGGVYGRAENCSRKLGIERLRFAGQTAAKIIARPRVACRICTQENTGSEDRCHPPRRF